MTTRENNSPLPELAAQAADDKKANDIQIMDMRSISPVTDYFVICSANSTTQVQAITDNIEDKLAEHGYNPLRREGYNEARWVLLDYGDCVVHVFLEEERHFYSLEQLWGEAQKRLYRDGE